ncbi:MAG TPA: NAD-dependent epimerase/dehydratase family protein [Chthoniobacteraceae bacterium]|nr:NAD-dependent epimerase/dehydratase family protein [Chthoniobacteraceae bacterium]
MTAPRRRAVVAGCGFVGLQVARQLDALGWEVTGLTHGEASARALAGERFPVVPLDITDRPALASLKEGGPWDAVVGCVSSGRQGAAVYRQVYLEGTRHLLEELTPARFVFSSSTSVYAQTDGSVVTETSETAPTRETGQILLDAETLVTAAGGNVVRLGGLYAPGRWALLERFLDGRAVMEESGKRYINQIHRDDAAAALVFMLTGAGGGALPPGIYNATDGSPLTQREAYTLFSDLLGKPLPPSGPIDWNRKRGWSSKRVGIGKLLAAGWRPQHPDCRKFL